MKKLLCSSSFALATAAFFAACGDETTNVTETTGPKTIAEFKNLGDCTSDNAGDLVYVKDSATAYLCADSVWKNMLNASVTKGENGTSCTGEANEDGSITISCDGEVVGTLKNGENGTNGTNGTNGENGTSCTGKANEDGSVTISCDGEVVGTIKNGENGTNGTNGTNGENGTSCGIVSDKDGVVSLKCGEGNDAVETVLYKAVCGATAYDPEKKFCFNMELYDLCGGKPYVPTQYECVENVAQKLVETTCGGEEFDPETQFCAKKGLTVMGVYKKVTIGNGDDAQTWMAKNLNYETESGSFCYDDDDKNCTKYGRLYTRAAADEACPDGWHLPTQDEFEKLIANADASLDGNNNAGTALKTKSDWQNNGNGSNDVGFSARPVGYRNLDGEFLNEGGGTYFWSASKDKSDLDMYKNFFYAMSLTHNHEYADLGSYDKNHAYSVRCIQDKQN